MCCEGKQRKVNFDIDGVLAEAPIPGRTLVALLVKNFSYSVLLGQEYKPYQNGGSSLTKTFGRILSPLITPYEKRLIKKGTLEGLFKFLDIARSDGLDLTLGILSGRELPSHQATLDWLYNKRPILGVLFKEQLVSLNKGNSSSLWKKIQTGIDATHFHSVTQVDDDPKVAIRCALLNGITIPISHDQEKTAITMSYLVDNFVSRPGLFRWAGVELPENVVRVKSISDAAVDYKKRILDGRI